MTNILELLKNEKVEWKKLGEVCEFINGFAFKSSLFSQSGEAVIRITNINSGKVTFDDLKYIKLDDYPELDRYKVEKNNILVAMSGATTGKIGYQYEDRIGYLNQRVGKFIPDESKVKRRFLFHFLYNIESELFSLATGSGAQPNLSSEAIKKIDIPIPSLEIQERIVKILDKFTNYVTELQSELQSRTKQYTYYRDKLLSEEYLNKITQNKINNFSLKSVAEYSSKRISAEELDIFNYVGVDNLLKDKYGREDSSYVPETGTSTRFEKGDILIGNIRPYLRKIWHADRIGGTNGDVLAVSVKSEDIIDSRYLYHVLADEKFFDYNIKYSKGAKMPRGDKNKIMEYHFPIPPLHVQQHVVSILDKFDTLVNDIKEGLPKEIEQRQKQYEYWRSVLLIFK